MVWIKNLRIFWHRREARLLLERERYLARELIETQDARYATQLRSEIRNAAFARRLHSSSLCRLGVLL